MRDAATILHLQGPEPSRADGLLVLLHGRGGTAADLGPLAEATAGPGVAVLAPQAPGHTWYPNRFLAPREANEPWLSGALDTVDGIVRAAVVAGVPRDRIVIAGFSQGACLAAEYVARHPGRYGGCVAFAGALIGPDPESGGYSGDLEGSPVHVAVGDRDEHVPPAFAEASVRVLQSRGARVTLAVHSGMGHMIHPDDVAVLADLLRLHDQTT